MMNKIINNNHSSKILATMMLLLFLVLCDNLKAEYINKNLKFVKQGFINTYFTDCVDKSEKINWDSDVLIINNDAGVYAVLNKTVNVDDEKCLAVVNLLNDKKTYFVIGKALKRFDKVVFFDNKLYIGSSQGHVVFEKTKQEGNKVYYDNMKMLSTRLCYDQNNMTVINDTVYFSTNYGAYLKQDKEGRFYSVIYLDKENKFSELQYLNNPQTPFFDFYSPKSAISISKNLIASVDNSKYNIFIYDKKCNPIDTIHGQFAINNFISDKEIKDFEKTLDYQGQAGKVIAMTDEKALFGKISLLKNVNLINDSTLLVCYTKPKNSTSDPIGSMFDYDILFDIWKFHNGDWQLDPADSKLKNPTFEETGIVDKNQIPLYDTYRLGTKYLYISSIVPIELTKSIKFSEYKKLEDEYYTEHDSPGSFFIYTFEP